ncbi:circadian clock KaiB family protein [Legionella pneumophila serogroup 1]|uniref:circadian clock KaiB family protein n=1 Tax=Legionella pneumophila TaxID=446 RepID=UPI000493D5D7|nr:circadian clock KaiB family protein [Legionella pneumophila]HAT8894371.1 circadian clock protein KaiB [Legionella pneumophila subsp. pneumophila]MCO1451200.1 circadian clock KaiB family protein [Legionella pneumophila]MCW8402051.1 circadian clock KaiB family protein [Legionella pneumophila]MCZ4688128.1 circadian clock KaiB family protein [Legionella pneumophila]MCZ4697526.1 circadian clock KaiB family protein [Legionella pneumophila]
MTRTKLKLFVIGNSAISKRAIINLQSICSDPKLADLCDVEVVDLCINKGVAEEEKILATPVLIKKEPLPERRIIGDLSDKQKVISALEMD